MNKTKVIFFILFAFTICCNSPYAPKPKSYPRILFPKKEFYTTRIPNNPVFFTLPNYSHLVQEPSNIDDDIWYNIDIPSLGGKIYLTYKPIKNDLDILIKDCYKITYKQQTKATIIKDSAFITRNNNNAILFYVGGNAATKYQFLVTDKKKHFLRGSLYFNTTPNEDSLLIVQNFLKPDIDTLISSLIFKSW